MLVFSAIVPHAPFLIDAIGKDDTKKIARTEEALAALERELYAVHPDALLIITPHGTALRNGFALNIAPSHEVNLEEFGDMSTHQSFLSDISLAGAIRKKVRTESQIPLVLQSEPKLDYGSAIPLLLLTRHMPDIKVVTVFDSPRPLSDHFLFGKMLHRIILHSTKRIAVIASADLAHTLTDDAPGGFSPEGRKFDETIVQLVRDNDLEQLMTLEKQAQSARACGLRPMVIFHGIIKGLNTKPNILSYEGPFGVGYMVAHFELY